ncbi:hypothetical protein BGX21_006609 [Mortierella sp. AD011]|nr:hypothetical protein BGX21_006609 [Mortierella sp. AD011]
MVLLHRCFQMRSVAWLSRYPMKLWMTWRAIVRGDWKYSLHSAIRLHGVIPRYNVTEGDLRRPRIKHVMDDQITKNVCDKVGPFLSKREDTTDADGNDLMFTFSCILGHYDISAPFNTYYEEAIAQPYDYRNYGDFLATAGIVFLREEPRAMQRQHFGEYYNNLREMMFELIQASDDDSHYLTDEEDVVVTFFQETRKIK